MFRSRSETRPLLRNIPQCPLLFFFFLTSSLHSSQGLKNITLLSNQKLRAGQPANYVLFHVDSHLYPHLGRLKLLASSSGDTAWNKLQNTQDYPLERLQYQVFPPRC